VKKALAVAVLTVMGAGFVTFVYPTRYRIEQGTVNGHRVTMRIDRLTGDVEYATPHGWDKSQRPGSGLSDKTKAILEGRN
jgi:hypothetical protein